MLRIFSLPTFFTISSKPASLDKLDLWGESTLLNNIPNLSMERPSFIYNRGYTGQAEETKQRKVVINRNFDGVEMTREEIKKLAEQLAECLEDAAGAAGNEDS